MFQKKPGGAYFCAIVTQPASPIDALGVGPSDCGL